MTGIFIGKSCTEQAIICGIIAILWGFFAHDLDKEEKEKIAHRTNITRRERRRKAEHMEQAAKYIQGRY